MQCCVKLIVEIGKKMQIAQNISIAMNTISNKYHSSHFADKQFIQIQNVKK